uniref:Extracellular matrix protein 1b n=1 Tax=Cyprinodon variegatus TaxID=28743 RepID=A0A3Q2DLJ7_CYPVA
MSSSAALVSAAVASLLVLSSACKDAQTCVQSESTISHPFQGQEPFASEGELPPSRPNFGPRSFFPALSYPVQFPLGQPTADNIEAICVNSDHRPRYPESYFPNSGFGKQKRQATAVNNAEWWFSTCCKGNQTWGTEMTLCCATQAWQQSVNLFCEEDSSVKDRLYHCCRRTDTSRFQCFKENAQNPNYEPTLELPVEEVGSTQSFNFNQDTCPRNLMSPHLARASREKTELNPAASPKTDIIFPPGRPSAINIESLCSNQKFRPLYSTKCLPRSGYEVLAHQVKTINRLEKKYKQCCKKKKGALQCAEQKWRLELNRYCSGKIAGQIDLQCCQSKDPFGCFQTVSLDPLYNKTSEKEAPALSTMCDTKIFTDNRFPVGFQLKSLCCPLSEQDRNPCFAQKIEQLSQSLCSSDTFSTAAVYRCCKRTSPEEISQCVGENVMGFINKQLKKRGQRKNKKICPIP